MNTLVKSDLESERFKINFFRGRYDSIDIKEIQKIIIQNSIDVSVIRIPSEKNYQVQELSKIGFEYFQADTLVYYYTNLANSDYDSLKNDNINFKISTKEDIPILDFLISSIFSNYRNHYFSNKYLDTLNSLEGYKQWVFNFIDKKNHIVFLVYKEDQPIGFASCSIDHDNVAEGILYGVLNEFSGGGVYTDIIRFTKNYYKKLNIEKMKVSTQVHNFAVQKVWSREGFFMCESYSTIHINSLLSLSKIPAKNFSLKITENDIVKYGEISKDYNSIHFNDEDARILNFNGKIAHALLSEGEISRILGMEFPGNSTIILNNYNLFFTPFYPDNNYRFCLTVPFMNDKGFFKILFKVYDEKDNLVMMSYNDVINKTILIS